MSPFSVFTFFLAIITSSLTVSREIGPSASYYSPWDPIHHTQTATVDVEDPKFASLTKTGTTIVGISCRDGVVLGADTRSTGGPLVMDKNKLKIHVIASRIFCCAAGTSADCDQITRKASHELQLLRLERELCGEDYLFDPIQAALISVTDSLDKAPGGRKPSSVMILGGIDDSGPALYIIDDSKVPQRVNFAALGSGSTDAIAMLENAKVHWLKRSKVNSQLSSMKSKKQDTPDDNRYAEDIDIETAIKSVRQAVHAGILNDLGSGSHIDICVIQKEGVRQWRESLSSDWEKQKSLTHDEKIRKIEIQNPATDSTIDSSPLINENIIAVKKRPSNLGELIYSRAKLSNFLVKDSTDESSIKISEVRERSKEDNTSCYIQKI